MSIPPASRFASRLARARDALRTEKIDALVVTHLPNVRYLTGLRIIMLQYRASTTYGVFLHQDGELVLFLSSGELVRAKQRMPWIGQFEPIPIMDEAGLVADAIVADEVRL